MYFTLAMSLFLAAVALASQLSFDILGFPNPAIRNRTCSLEDEDVFRISTLSHLQVCPIPPETVATNPVTSSPASLNSTEPWTETPSCIEALDKSETYCVYTSSTFARGRGISLFTTPSVAKDIAQSVAFREGEILDNVNVVSNPPYIMQSLPGRGMGLIVNRTLQRGDHIFSHTPVVVVHRGAFEAFNQDDRFTFQRDAVNRLPKQSQELFLALHGHFGGDNVDDIITTNAFSVDLDEDEESHNVILPETSRMNHDCRPNAHYYFDVKTLTHHVHAIRTIQAGEELTISYTDGAALHDERQAAIKLSWGFDCSCSLCTQREIFIRESDKRLEIIADLHTILDDWSNTSAATPEMAETLISLYEQERLHAPIALAHTHAALAYNAVGMEYVALKYAALAIEYGILNSGPHFEDVEVMQELMKNPKSHWSWRLRLSS